MFGDGAGQIASPGQRYAKIVAIDLIVRLQAHGPRVNFGGVTMFRQRRERNADDQ